MPSLSSCRSVNSAVNLALGLRPARRSPVPVGPASLSLALYSRVSTLAAFIATGQTDVR